MKNKVFILFRKLLPVYRTLAGPGNLKALNLIKSFSYKLKILKFASGKKVFDWVIPNEWIIKDAYIKDIRGKKIVDFNQNNLHAVVNSIPVNKIVPLSLLKKKVLRIPILKNTRFPMLRHIIKDWGFAYPIIN